MTDVTMPRGMRVNNPCNIKITPIHWMGKVIPSADDEFEQFEAIEYGLRAGILILKDYQLHDRERSIADFISRWAPSSITDPEDDNPTAAYIANVATYCGVDKDAPYDVTIPANMCKILGAIVRQEQGSDAYVSQETILSVVTNVLNGRVPVVA